jgi:hypothetical protein
MPTAITGWGRQQPRAERAPVGQPSTAGSQRLASLHVAARQLIDDLAANFRPRLVVHLDPVGDLGWLASKVSLRWRHSVS